MRIEKSTTEAQPLKDARGRIARAFSFVEDVVYVGMGVLLAYSALALLVVGAMDVWRTSLFGGAAARSDQSPRPDASRPHAGRAALYGAGVVPRARASAGALPHRRPHRGAPPDPRRHRGILGGAEGRRAGALPRGD